MALIKCPECKKKISNTVKACPHCGYVLSELEKEKQMLEEQKRILEEEKIKLEEKQKQIIQENEIEKENLKLENEQSLKETLEQKKKMLDFYEEIYFFNDGPSPDNFSGFLSLQC